MMREPVLFDPETDALLVELRPWPAASPAEVSDHVRGEGAEEGLVIHPGPDGLPHASERPDLVARALGALRAVKGYAA